MNTHILRPLLLGIPTLQWIRLLLTNKWTDLSYLPSVICVTAFSLLLFPFRFIEKIKFNNVIQETTIDKPPIFIIGHWRSGTTNLHNILAQDADFAYPSIFQMWAINFLLVGKKIFKPLLHKLLPSKRPMDNMEIAVDYPQEEEFAMANLSPHCLYHGLYFPSCLKTYFEKYVLFSNVSESVKNEWKKSYLFLLKKITYINLGKQLILKNPVNTARISLLLMLFPNAKFIHIYRNPYIVYFSTKKLYQTMIKEYSLESFSDDILSQNILDFYKGMMESFFAEKSLIPSENLFEIRYEDFIGHELKHLKLLYTQFNLDGFAKAEIAFADYLKNIENYETNKYEFNENTLNIVADNWQFAFDRLNYSIADKPH